MSIKVYVKQGEKSSTKVRAIGAKIQAGSFSPISDIVEDLLDLMDSAYVVPYLMASGVVVGNGAIGPGYGIAKDGHYTGTEEEKETLYKFFNYVPPVYKNIKDMWGTLSKVFTTAYMLKIFGVAAWEIIVDEGGTPIGFDVIPGIVKPNIEPDGTFKRPAFTQYLRINGVTSKVDFDMTEKVVHFSMPDFRGGIWLASSLVLSDYTLPSEIYAAKAYLSLHENRNAPYSGIWYAPEGIGDEDFDKFVAIIEARYRGSKNYGKNPIVMRGKGGFESLKVDNAEMPYDKGRGITRHEIGAATGVPGPKYGVDLESLNQSGWIEIRREFYETTLMPLMSVIEETIYNQICVRLFNIKGWRFRFSRPDFTSAVEDASIALRRIQWGEWSPNEARIDRGELPREGGDYYLLPLNMAIQGEGGTAEQPGRPTNDPVDDDEGDPLPADENPVPETEPPEAPSDKIIGELKAWKRFHLRQISGKRPMREFHVSAIPAKVARKIIELLRAAGDSKEMVVAIFDSMEELYSDTDESGISLGVL